jgi:hypothetical protein
LTERAEDDNEPTPTVEAHRWADETVDDAGIPLRVIPATTYYSWSGTGADCSINKNVSAQLPTNRLLRGSGLVRHPDRPDWYDSSGTLIATYRWAQRPTGEVRTLLVRQDWLARRLDELDYDLIIGLIGELQTTKEIPSVWRQFSQCVSLQTDSTPKPVHTLTMLRRRR